MKYLVTGGGGFLGRHIVDRLLERGDCVRVIGRRTYPDLLKCGVECVQGDLADKDVVSQACEGVEAVFHVASKTGISGRFADYYNANVTGTKNVIAACRLCGVTKLVYTSTPSVVFGKEPIENGDESLPYPDKYLTAYAATKAEAEIAVLGANSGGGLYTCSLRPHLIWGPGDTNLIPRIIDKARSGRLRQVGDGENLVSVSYVENTASAHLAAEQKLGKGQPASGKAYFINEPEPVNCWAFINRILRSVGAPEIEKQISFKKAYMAGAVLEFLGALRPQWEPPMTRFLALQLACSHYFKIDKAQQDLGWRPEVSIDEGLQRLADSLK